MTNEEADHAFQAVHDAQRQAQLLYMDLRDAGDSDGARAAKMRVDRIQTEIDSLISTELDHWKEGAERLIPQLEDLSAAAQKAVDAVATDVKNARNVVEAMKTLDKVISTAVKFVA